MAQELLVPVDDTAVAPLALPVAEALAKAMGARIVRFHVQAARRESGLESPAHVPAVTIGDLDPNLAPAAVSVRSVVSPVDVPQAIVDEAVRRDARLIVMGTRARSGAGRVALGSVADEVLAKSPIPVVLVRAGEEPIEAIRTLLVPVDGTPGGSLALGIAVELARAASAKVVALRVVAQEADMDTLISNAGIGMGTRGYVIDTWEQAALDSARYYVQRLVEPLGKLGVRAEARSAFGDPARTIVRVADEVGADLVVMSTRARRGLARALLGSVAAHVVRSSKHPVLLVRRPRGTAPKGAPASSTQEAPAPAGA